MIVCMVTICFPQFKKLSLDFAAVDFVGFAEVVRSVEWAGYTLDKG
jgi:hypothetical protein